jgi:hypothetical protein
LTSGPRRARKAKAAENQHYVPKFILRNFVRDLVKEQVNVFSKSTGRTFTPSINGIMAERRFNEFAIGEDYIASFEEAIGRIENWLVPTYRRILETRRLEKTPQEQATLALFIAFQFLRTRSMRDQFASFEQFLDKELKKRGGRIEDLEGYEPSTEDDRKMEHIRFLRDALPQFATIVAGKDLFLMQAPEGRSFYLGDNPVSLHNSTEPDHPIYGSLGLAVRGIEIYVPLSADLMLAAWCPTIMQLVRKSGRDSRRRLAGAFLKLVSAARLSPDGMRQNLAKFDEAAAPLYELVETFEAGTPMLLEPTNMDFSNALQMHYARELVICPDGDFGLAQAFMADNPKHRGVRIGTPIDSAA